MTTDTPDYTRWLGGTETRADTLTLFPATALAATLDRDDAPRDGDPLPPLWHWLYFLHVFPMHAAGYDGHAALGGFLPPVPLPRRMWAGGRLTFHAPLHLGDAAEKTSTITQITRKAGRSGDMVFVTVRHDIATANGPCITEEHDIVYRAAPDPAAPVRPPEQAPQDAFATRAITPDPVLLFRYSALTFNGHRIHYDKPFCADEGYDGLVVHGPLLATCLTELLRDTLPDRTLRRFRFRALAPVTDGAAFTANMATPDGDQTRLWITRADGALAMQAEADLA